MKANTASYTAQVMALYRAMETRRPEPHRLFSDPYAHRFLSGKLRLAAWLCGIKAGEAWLYRYLQKRIPGALASGLARTRYIDDLVNAQVKDGVQQVVLLGAGFDTRGLRLPCLRNIPVIEIDHPNTAAQKRSLLKTVPPNIRYLSIDFNRESLAGVFPSQDVRTLFIWEGVTNYLNKDAVDKVLTYISGYPDGSAIIFTYIDRQVLDNPASYFGASTLISDLNQIEERWTFGLAPEAVAGYLREKGLTLREDLGAQAYRERYLGKRKGILKGYEFYHVALAEKSLPPALI